MNKIIGKFIPIGGSFHREEFNVFSKVPSDYLAPAWKGIKEDGDEYHVTEDAWKFEPLSWSGEGLPPVGVECEFCDCEDWCVVKVKFIGDKYAVLQDLKFDVEKVYCVADKPDKFRPIRSPEDVARDVATKAFNDIGVMNLMHARHIYDAIAAGKIPGVKLEVQSAN